MSACPAGTSPAAPAASAARAGRGKGILAARTPPQMAPHGRVRGADARNDGEDRRGDSNGDGGGFERDAAATRVVTCAQAAGTQQQTLIVVASLRRHCKRVVQSTALTAWRKGLITHRVCVCASVSVIERLEGLDHHSRHVSSRRKT